MMVRTHGLTHLAIAVRDVERAASFYRKVFGMNECFREPGRIDLTTPGCSDIITFNEDPAHAGPGGGIAHIGFRLVAPEDIDVAVREVEAAGGVLLRRGEFAPGVPYAYVNDPDGYEIEIWFE